MLSWFTPLNSLGTCSFDEPFLNRRMGMPLCERYYMCIISIYMKLIPSCLRFEVKIHTLIVELDNLDLNQGLT